jgi:endonuclease/exonuclease/phosphatase family metal-dependent hydrolase
MSYVYNTLADRLNDAFVEAGSGAGCTFRPMHHVLRIDYILYSDGIEIHKYSADHSATMSDHLPVMARFKPQTK